MGEKTVSPPTAIHLVAKPLCCQETGKVALSTLNGTDKFFFIQMSTAQAQGLSLFSDLFSDLLAFHYAGYRLYNFVFYDTFPWQL